MDRRVSLGPEPEPEFPAWDGESVILYDIASGDTVNLGPGGLGTVPFNADGTKFIYASGDPHGEERPRVTIYDLATGEQREYGSGYAPSFEDDGTFSAQPEYGFGSFDDDHFDVATGELVFPEPNRPDSTDGWVLTTRSSEGWMLQSVYDRSTDEQQALVLPPGAAEAFELPEGSFAWPLPGGDAFRALVVQPEPGSEEPAYSNLFLMETNGMTEWLATMQGPLPQNNVIALGSDYFAWTEDYCGPEPGRTYVLYFATGELVEVDRALALSPRGGEEIALGSPLVPFRQRVLLDARTFEYLRVMPGLPAWNAQRTWAANGQHGSERVNALLDLDFCAEFEAEATPPGTATPAS